MDISVLVGKTLKAVYEMNEDGDEIIFETVDGKKYRMYHEQNCCESVTIDDICGRLEDLLNTPILVAEERTNSVEEYDEEDDNYTPSQTWTFYCIRTIKGTVDIRWYGTSNGYYSERVDFEEVL